MWYNSRPMARRGLTLALLALIAFQLLGAVGGAACLEPCAEEESEAGCATACSLCATCTHAQALVRTMAAVQPQPGTAHASPSHGPGRASQRADEIFHVPLAS